MPKGRGYPQPGFDDFLKKCDNLEQMQGEAFSLPTTITQLSRYFDVPVFAVRKRLEQIGRFQGQGGAVIVDDNIDKSENTE